LSAQDEAACVGAGEVRADLQPGDAVKPRITNKPVRPIVNERAWTRAKVSIFKELSDEPCALITAWLQVRVLPGPPLKKYLFVFIYFFRLAPAPDG
jgi:hypothetical protein